MKKIIVAITIFILSTGLCLPSISTVTAQDSAAVTIVSPSDGDVMVGHNPEFNGKGPKNTLITVDITDADTSRPIIEHQKFGHVSGSTTSDADGEWVFVPQEELVPGKFAVSASYKAQNETVKSEEVSFTVVDDGGSSGRLSAPTVRRLIIGAALVVLITSTCIILLVRRRRRPSGGALPVPQPHTPIDPDRDEDSTPTSLFLRTREGQHFVEQESKRMSALDAEAVKIEEELAVAAEQLERTNAEVAQLRQRLTKHESPPDTPSDDTRQHKKSQK